MDGEKKQETLSISLEDREFSREEFSKLDEKCLAYLNEQLKGQNASLEMVSAPLNFVSNVPKTGIEFSWILPEDYINADGTLNFAKIPDEGVQTNVAAQAKWRNWEKEYTFPLTINGSVLPEGERAINQIKNVMLEKIEEQKTQKEIALPAKVGGYEVHYSEVEQKKKPPYYLLSVLAILFFASCSSNKRESIGSVVKSFTAIAPPNPFLMEPFSLNVFKSLRMVSLETEK